MFTKTFRTVPFGRRRIPLSRGRYLPVPVAVGLILLLLSLVLGLTFAALFQRNSTPTGSPISAFRPRDALGQHLLTACGLVEEDARIQRTLLVDGLARTAGRTFTDPTEGFGGHVRANAGIEVKGNGYVDGHAMPGPDHTVRIRGNGVVTGSTDPASEILGCSLKNLEDLVLWVQDNHQNDDIP